MKNIIRLLIVLVLCTTAIHIDNLYAQSTQSGEEVVHKLINSMTLDEKLTLLAGQPDNSKNQEYQAGFLGGIPRLGIPSLKLTDGPPGVTVKDYSTGMTASMGLAATFSHEDAYNNGVVIGRDGRALGQDVVLEPFVNIYRDPTWPRGYNTFGEDPLLTGQTAAAEIRGIQSQDEMAQVKHYIAYDGANNVDVDERTLHEIYLQPFDDAIKAGVASIMSSYNQVNGYFASNNAHFLIDILRNELGFKGFVTSDWGAIHSTAYINAGEEMEMPGSGGPYPGLIAAYFTPKELKQAIVNGTVRVSTIDTAVSHILYEYYKFGYLNGKSKHSITQVPVDENEKVVLKTGEDAATLLKNENQTLPLTNAELRSLVLIGPGAGQTIATAGGGYADLKSVGFPSLQTGTYQVLKKEIGRHGRVSYSVGDDMNGTPVPSSAFTHDGRRGLIQTNTKTSQSVLSRNIENTLSHKNALPAGGSYSWIGSLNVPATGLYWINIQSLGATAQLSLDGKVVGCSSCGFYFSKPMPYPNYGNVHPGENAILPTPDGLDNARYEIQLTAGEHTIKVDEHPDQSGNPVQVRLNWVTPQQRTSNFKAAVEAAKKASTAIVFAWSTSGLNTPLPEHQDSLIESVAAVNPNTIVVLNTSNPIFMPWLSKVKAVLEMWYPGDKGGYATTNILTGKISPAGRLPFTWPAKLDQGPANQPKLHPERTPLGVDSLGNACKSAGEDGPDSHSACVTIYSEGIFVGYRFYDKNHETPLYPFGYGLSYTSFKYSGLEVKDNEDGGLTVSFDITNTSKIDGDEVPQVYLGPPANPPKGVPFAVKALAAYNRVNVPAGKTVHVTENVPLRQLQYWSTAGGWNLAKGNRIVYVGASSRDLRAFRNVSIGGK